MSEQTASLCTTDAAESLRAVVAERDREIERLRLNIAEYNEHERCYQSEIAALKAQPSGVVLPEPLRQVIGRADDILHALSGWDSSSVKLEQRHGAGWLKEIDAIRRELHTQLARLNSPPVSAGEPVYQFQCREIGEGGFDACDHDRYIYCQKSPEHDTRVVQVGISAGGVDERAAFEAWAASVGYHTERDMFQREKYQSTLTWELWRVWQARAALSAPSHGEKVREVCRHEFSDDGEFTVHCSKCDLTINAEPPRHVLDSAAQQAFEAGGTEGGGYVLTGDDLDQIVAQACAEAVIEFAAAPSAGSQEQE